jgi:hypothetical protein
MGIERFTKKGVALRRSPRERVNHIVRLQFDDGSPALCGTLSDLSATGARVTLADAGQLPAKFVMILPPNTRRVCRLMWQSREDFGVEFLAAGARAAAPAVHQPQPAAPQAQPGQGRPVAAGPARSGPPGSARGSLPLWDYSDNHRPKRR